jgi:hypothetical protein
LQLLVLFLMPGSNQEQLNTIPSLDWAVGSGLSKSISPCCLPVIPVLPRSVFAKGLIPKQSSTYRRNRDCFNLLHKFRNDGKGSGSPIKLVPARFWLEVLRDDKMGVIPADC